ncbi:MAG TPA: protein kinase, partial [Blastocatellia bacterium]|nr:protein kinase [Blastocatellia bacterium]
MTPDRWARIDQLLDEAMERPATERSAFLDGACLDDQELRREVESLLAAHEKAEEKFLKLPALDLAAQHLAADKDRSLIGQTISHYGVISVLGVGGMGEVYLARDSKLARKVALKLLPPRFTQDAARIKRFEREARAASALNHPNIITIYEIGEVEHRHFIAAEFVDGQTLRELLSEGRVAMKDAVEIAVQIASALVAAHEAGIVHRDIKPENVMLRRDGYVKVLDFGLVKLTEQRYSGRAAGATNASEDDPAKTNPGTVIGTVRYMSPEQAMGQEVDQRSDLFSLGVVLYELLTGLPPFKGNHSAAILDAIIHYREVPITQIRPDLNAELERIVHRALEKDRELRFQTANDLRADLKRLQRELDSAEVAAARRASVNQPPPPGKWKNASLALAVAAGLIAVALPAWRFFRREALPVTNWAEAKFTTLTDFPGREGSPTISPDGQTFVYSRMVNGQWEIFRQRVGGSNAVNLTNHPASNGDAAFSHKGDKIAFYSGRDGGGLYVMEETGENPRRFVDGGRDPDWAPDDKEIVYSTAAGSN